MAVVLGAAVSLERRLVLLVLTAELVSAVPHMVFHITHLEQFPPADAIAQTTVLAATAAVLIALLVLATQLGRDGSCAAHAACVANLYGGSWFSRDVMTRIVEGLWRSRS